MTELNEMLDRLKQGPSQSPQRNETTETAEIRQTLAKGAGKSCPRRLSALRKCTRQPNSAGSSWQNQQTLPICQAIYTVGYAERTSPCSHMGILKCCGISTAVVTSPVISACVWKQLDGACWISTEILWVRMSWIGRRGRSRRVHLWYVTVSIRLRRTWSPLKLMLLTLSCRFWQTCLAWWMRWDGRQLKTLWEAVAAVFANRRASQHWSSLNTLPESLRLVPNFLCCFASIQSCYLERYPKFCRPWLVGLRFTILQPWIQGAWCGIVGLHANVGERHFPSGFRGRYRPLLQWCQTRVVSAWVSCDRCGWFGVPRCCLWWVACVGRYLRQ